MKKLCLLLLLIGCAHQKNVSDKEINNYCQDLNVLYQKISLLTSNIANVKTTRIAEGGYYKRKIAKSCKNGFCEIINDDTPPILKYEPKHHDANNKGYVAYPNINIIVEEAHITRWKRVFETVHANSAVSKYDRPLGKLGLCLGTVRTNSGRHRADDQWQVER